MGMRLEKKEEEPIPMKMHQGQPIPAWLIEKEIPGTAPSIEQLTSYARQIALSMAKHWSDTSPNWTPFDDLGGILTQIDNMAAGMIRGPSKEQGKKEEKDDQWLKFDEDAKNEAEREAFAKENWKKLKETFKANLASETERPSPIASLAQKAEDLITSAMQINQKALSRLQAAARAIREEEDKARGKEDNEAGC
jgi:hypothetical protein